MRTLFSGARFRAFTLPELLVSVALTSVLGLIVYGYLRSGLDMFARNSAIDHSHIALRSVVDRLSDTLDSSDDVPVLITDTAAATSQTGWAAGMHFDRFIGEPYILHDMSTATTLAASATSFVVKYQNADIAKVPTPVAGDTMLVDILTGTVRARISSVSPANPTPDGSGFCTVTLTLAAPLGKAISWTAGEPRIGRLVRHEAFLVKTGTTNRVELRHYRNFEPVPSNLNDTANYVMITNQLSTATADLTPFRIVTPSGDRMPEINLKIMARDYLEWLSTKQTGGFNNFSWGTMRLPTRLRARVQN